VFSREQTIKKYLKPPSIELILKVVKSAGVKPAQFEIFFGIAKGTIKQVKIGSRAMPAKHWELFYEWGKNKKAFKRVTKRVTHASDRLKALLD
jgi:hypothetical protein